MSEPVWIKFLSERDKQVFGDAGFEQRAGFGERPVILVIDVNYNFTGDKPEPILESIKRWPLSCGEEAWDSMRHIKKLIEAGRAKGVPVIYTTGTGRPDGWDRGSWAWKNRRTAERRSETHGTNLDGNEINAEVKPAPQDIIIKKLKPSGFHGTPLNSFLTNFKADSILMAGTTTSGCIRASVIDAFSENYRVTLVEEGCFDRSEVSHAINLCDMNAKYADIVGIDEVIAYIEGLPSDLFDLPRGTPD